MPDEELINEIRKLLAQGKTQQQIAELTGRSRSTITRAMPLVRSQPEHQDRFTWVQAMRIDTDGSPSITLNLREFCKAVESQYPIYYQSHSSNLPIVQFQENVIIALDRNQVSPFCWPQLITNPSHWLEIVIDKNIKNDHHVRKLIDQIRIIYQNIRSIVPGYIHNYSEEWFGHDYDSMGRFFPQLKRHTEEDYVAVIQKNLIHSLHFAVDEGYVRQFTDLLENANLDIESLPTPIYFQLLQDPTPVQVEFDISQEIDEIITPERILTKVDFPAPFSPSKA